MGDTGNNRELDLRAMADAFVGSSKRSRYVIMVLVFTSILIFIAYWNSRQASWINCRLPVAREAYKIMTEEGAEKDVKGMTEKERELYENARGLKEHRGYLDSADARQRLDDLERVRAERVVSVPIPIFGVLVDVNDLGLLGGFAFTVILLWLKFGLSKEYTNLRLVFHEARKSGQLESCYYYLAMQQMLTIPRGVRSMRDQPNRSFWNTVPNLLVVLPLTVQSVVILHDLGTFDLGELTRASNALAGVIVGSIFLGIILVLTVRCFVLVLDTDKEWDRAAWELEGEGEAKEDKDKRT